MNQQQQQEQQHLMIDVTNLTSLLQTKYPYNTTTIHKPYYAYGTAGFREYATELYPIMIRIGFGMALYTHIYVQEQQQEQQQESIKEEDATTTRMKLPSIHFGIMITASHNDYRYNGVKCIHVDGGMIPSTTETLLTSIVNIERSSSTTSTTPDSNTTMGTIESLLSYIQTLSVPIQMINNNNNNNTTTNNNKKKYTMNYEKPTIHIGYDTRSHSIIFAKIVMEGIQQLLLSTTSSNSNTIPAACTIVNHGIVTTPILHHIVKHCNGSIGYYHTIPSIIPTSLYISGYYSIICNAYIALFNTKPTTTTTTNSSKVLHVDCACGVGYTHLSTIVQQIQQTLSISSSSVSLSDTSHSSSSSSSSGNSTTIQIHNAPSKTNESLLNHQCGSEYVQKQQCSCVWYNNCSDDGDDSTKNTDTSNMDYSYCASIDGDGDRIVFFSSTTTNTTDTAMSNETSSSSSSSPFVLLDGDYIACLICQFIQNEIQLLVSYYEDYYSNTPGIESSSSSSSSLLNIKLGVVQTAYANGASTKYLRDDQKIHVIMAKTGVKYVHAAAHDNFDIGIYFESNGHGTVIFNHAYYTFLSTMEQVLYHSDTQSRRPSPNVFCAYQRLKILPNLINQAVGDAISDLLLIDAILSIKGWTLLDWYQSLYTNLPSRQMKVQVKDRTIIQTNDNETQCISPITVQPKLNELMDQYSTQQARVFIRPSGTEDVVRIYAEATTQDLADTLAQQAISIVQEFCGGL